MFSGYKIVFSPFFRQIFLPQPVKLASKHETTHNVYSTVQKSIGVRFNLYPPWGSRSGEYKTCGSTKVALLTFEGEPKEDISRGYFQMFLSSWG